MTTFGRGLGVSCVASAALACAAVAQDGAEVFDVPSDGRLTVAVNGRSMEAFSAPGMPSVLSLRRSVALAALGNGAEEPNEPVSFLFGLLSFVRGSDSRIGPTLIKGHVKEATLTLGPYTGTASVKFSDVDTYDTADALAGPWAIPFPVVRYQLHAPVDGERTLSVPLASETNWWIATTVRRMGGKKVDFALAPHFATTVASSAAGAAMARELGGTLDGPPERVLVSHGVVRPARAMRLDRPFQLGPLSIDQLLVRTTDYGTSGVIKDSYVDPSEAPGDIVVKGQTKSRASYTVYIGADALAGCSSITYDKPRRMIHLTCR